MKLFLPYFALSKPNFDICRCYKCCLLLLSIFSGTINSKSVNSSDITNHLQNPVIYDVALSSYIANNAVSSSNISDNQNNLTSSSKINANSETSDNDQEKFIQPSPQSSNYNNYDENQEDSIDSGYDHYESHYEIDENEAENNTNNDNGCGEMGFNCSTVTVPIIIDNVTQKGLCEELRTPLVWTDIIVLFSVAFIAAFAPYIPWVTYNQVYISVINCIGAGILLGTCFFHYMPEVQEKYMHSKDYDPHSLVFELWTMTGFLLILLCEQFFTTYFSKWFSDGGFPTHCHTHGDFGTPEHAHNHRHDAQQNPEANPLPEKRGLLNDTSENIENESNGIISSPVNLAGHEDHCHEDIQSHSALRSLAFVASLGIHSIVEGGAVIMSAKKWSANQSMLISIAVHKIAVGLTMGFTLKSSNLKKQSAQIALFSWVCFSPLGGLLAFGACKYNIIESAVFMHLNAVGLGSFFYVLFFEIAPHEFLGSGENPSKFAKSLILVLGVVITLGMVMLFPHTHGGEVHCHGTYCH